MRTWSNQYYKNAKIYFKDYVIEIHDDDDGNYSILVALKKKKNYFIPGLKKLVRIWLWLQCQTFFQLKAVDGT